MTKKEVRAIYDMLTSGSDAIRPFTVVIDDNLKVTNTGMLGNSSTMRHLFPNNAVGQRYTAMVICRTDLFKDGIGVAIPEAGIADKLTGLGCTIGATDYRVMSANTDPTEAIIRIALDSVEQVGV